MRLEGPWALLKILKRGAEPGINAHQMWIVNNATSCEKDEKVTLNERLEKEELVVAAAQKCFVVIAADLLHELVLSEQLFEKDAIPDLSISGSSRRGIHFLIRTRGTQDSTSTFIICANHSISVPDGRLYR